jgi:signal transduction histidine kinase
VLSSLEVALGLAPPEGELHDVLEEGLESTRSAAQLGAALRTLSNETVFLSPGDVVPVVERALLAATAGTRLSLRIELPREPIVVEMDAHLVRRLFSELARSAISATTRPGVLRVRARVRRTSEGELLGLPSGGSVEIDVHDDGPGLPPELVPRIFDPYVGLKERVANRGVGLGLAACAAIAKKHRGHLSVDASPEGTAFRLVLPLAQAHRHE